MDHTGNKVCDLSCVIHGMDKLHLTVYYMSYGYIIFNYYVFIHLNHVHVYVAELILPTSNIFLNCFVLHDHSIFVFTDHCSLGQVTSLSLPVWSRDWCVWSL